MDVIKIEWNAEKNQSLMGIRGVSFERIAPLIREGDILDVYENPNQERYPGQQIFVVRIDDYAYLVPFIEQGGNIFLKTIIPSRKATRKYLGME
jgi:uncharacterized DUF497 family protein